MNWKIESLTVMTPYAVGEVHSFILSGGPLTLIDVGPRTTLVKEQLIAEFERLNYQLSTIEQIVLTHHHPDHAGWLELFPQATIYGHPYNDVWLRRDESYLAWHDEFYERCLREEGVPESEMKWIEKMKRSLVLMGERSLDHFLQKGDTLPGYPTWEVDEMLGHAESHLVFIEKNENVAITGDVLLAHIASNPLIEPPLQIGGERPKAMLAYMDSLKRLHALNLNAVYASHGPQLIVEPSALIEQRFAQIERRKQRLLDAIQGQGALTIYEITKLLYPEKYQTELGLTLSQVIGLLDLLTAEGILLEKKENGLYYYHD